MVIEILYAFCFYTFSKPSFFIFFVLIFTIANRSQNHVYMCLFAAPFKRCVIGLSYMEFTFMLYYIWELNDDEQIVGNNCRHVLNKCWIILDHQHTHTHAHSHKNCTSSLSFRKMRSVRSFDCLTSDHQSCKHQAYPWIPILFLFALWLFHGFIFCVFFFGFRFRVYLSNVIYFHYIALKFLLALIWLYLGISTN